MSDFPDRLDQWREQVRRRRQENVGRSETQKSCGHDQCALDLQTCCACSDQRAADTDVYYVYVDGEGMCRGERWSWYCDACKDTYREAELDHERLAEAHEEHMEEPHPQTNRRRERMMANYRRVFGTREDVEEDDYESPITTMFTRAWSRYRDAQQPLSPDFVPSVERYQPSEAQTSEELATDDLTRMTLEEAVDEFSRENSPAPLEETDLSDVLAVVRPPPAPADSLLNVECKICFSQIADILVLPCAHLVLCSYCAPILKLDGARDQRRDKCVMCRSKVTRKIKVFR